MKHWHLILFISCLTFHAEFASVLLVFSCKQNDLTCFLLPCLSTIKQAENFKKLCQTRKQEIQKCQKKIDEVWSIAREEAEKTKVAKEVIKALTSRVS